MRSWNPSLVARASCPFQRSRVTVMRLRVKVPVLSKQTSRMAPSASMASSRRTSTFLRDSARTPKASVVVTVVGSPSGTAATPSDTAERNSAARR